MGPAENAARLSLRKAVTVAKTIDNGLIVGADTVVVLGDELLSKPRDGADAIGMLRRLSGRTHTVVTAFTLVSRPDDAVLTETEETSVTFRTLPQDEIEKYVESGSPMDKAGAYGIQDDYGAVFVTRIEGCYYNVVGFPLARFWTAYQQFTGPTIVTKRNH